LRRIIKILGLEGIKEALKGEINDILRDLKLEGRVVHLSSYNFFKKVKIFSLAA
jgi:hypothetical protein